MFKLIHEPDGSDRVTEYFYQGKGLRPHEASKLDLTLTHIVSIDRRPTSRSIPPEPVPHFLQNSIPTAHQ